MNTLSVDFSSQLFQVFSASATFQSQRQESPPILPEPAATANLPAPANPTSGTPATTTGPQTGETAALTQTTETAAFLDFQVRIQLAEQKDSRSQTHELRHGTRGALKEIEHGVKGELKEIAEETPGLSEDNRHEIKQLAQEFKKALKQSFRDMFGDRHRAESAPLLTSPGELLSSVRAAFGNLVSRLNKLLDQGSGETANEPASNPAGATTEASPEVSPTSTSPSAPATIAAAAPTGTEPAPASTETPTQTTQDRADSPDNPLQTLLDTFEQLIGQLSDLFSRISPEPTTTPNNSTPAFSATVNLTFAFFSQTSIQFSSNSTGDTLNTIA